MEHDTAELMQILESMDGELERLGRIEAAARALIADCSTARAPSAKTYVALRVALDGEPLPPRTPSFVD